MRLWVAAVLVCHMMLGCEASGFSNVYMQVTASSGVIRGSVISQRAPGWSQIVAVHQNLDTATDGQRQHAPLTVVMELDRSVPRLYTAFTRGEPLDVQIAFWSHPRGTAGGGGETLLYTIKLTGAVLVGFDLQQHTTSQTEVRQVEQPSVQLQFEYNTISFEYAVSGGAPPVSGADSWAQSALLQLHDQFKEAVATTRYTTIYMYTEPAINGGTFQRGFEGLIAVLAVTEANEADRASNSRVHGPIVLTKEVDMASPRLFRAWSTGEELAEVELRFYHRVPGRSDEAEYFSLTLQKAKIKSIVLDQAYSTEAGAPNQNHIVPREVLGLTYDTVTWKSTEGGIIAEDSWENTVLGDGAEETAPASTTVSESPRSPLLSKGGGGDNSRPRTSVTRETHSNGGRFLSPQEYHPHSRQHKRKRARHHHRTRRP